MASQLPDGEPVPSDGSLPAEALATLETTPFAFYVHVPFCRVRCGYCDFNTYTIGELGGADAGPASPESYVAAAVAEVDLAARVLGPDAPSVDTIFFGGGTPTLLAVEQLGGVLGAIRARFSVAPDAEVSLEANPDSVDLERLEGLVAVGFNRISFGVQSFVPQVLATLDRTHDPAGVPGAVAAARRAGFASVSLDLIYGTPGESLDDWRTTLETALSLEPDHVSAYSLIVEEGTALARRVRRGELPMPDEDDLADKYELADRLFAAAGLEWYEVSNWARSVDHRCRHNLHYWRGANWWGIGPGAHSHVGGVRWWNVKHPSAYTGRLSEGVSPGFAREVLDARQVEVERVILQTRLAEGLDLRELPGADVRVLGELVNDGLVTLEADRRMILTERGRLLADAVVRALVADAE
jgi:oxygen-independent coproporphyrinogen-3 oxidase